MNFWRKLFGIKEKPPAPKGSCLYCKKETSEVNEYCNPDDPTRFRHWHCMQQECERRDKEREERKQIDLIKTAIREMDAEKLK